ncbi:class I SAM-dependent methyltransferase [Clostridium cellulovorans]|uniref:UbiE/COQ5 methyltransferase n=1 Tax=Clostridium cellulovorans (strain ATCC 35296 / DSM 3052 / OCM 3 / 743B) TaxID=573061 RepID=D9SWK8_CLOC7|nr:class I SAM-dependent methyltransferase [Clostridium cellulovorans]ADL53290.1 UbiE/COQ5 methyltransferase [Clostridium cellulovorans 743B]
MNKVYKNRDEFLCSVFDRAASAFGSKGPKYFQYFGKRLVELSNLQPKMKVLDVATGRGASLFPVVEIIGQLGFVTGIDFSKEMIVETKKEIRYEGYNNVQLLQMDAESLEFDDNSFDYVLCGLSIQFFTKYTDALREMNRVLKPNGRLGLSTWKRKDTTPFFMNIVAKYLRDVCVPYNMNKERGEFGTDESLRKMLSDVGFRKIQVIEEHKTFYYKNEDEWWQEQWSHAGRAAFELIKNLGDEVYNQFKEEVSKKLVENTDSKGIPFEASILYAFGDK